MKHYTEKGHPDENISSWDVNSTGYWSQSALDYVSGPLVDTIGS